MKVEIALCQLEECMTTGIVLACDWGAIFQWIEEIAAGYGAASPKSVAAAVLEEFLMPNGLKWDPAEGPLDVFFETAVLNHLSSQERYTAHVNDNNTQERNKFQGNHHEKRQSNGKVFSETCKTQQRK